MQRQQLFLHLLLLSRFNKIQPLLFLTLNFHQIYTKEKNTKQNINRRHNSTIVQQNLFFIIIFSYSFQLNYAKQKTTTTKQHQQKIHHNNITINNLLKKQQIPTHNNQAILNQTQKKQEYYTYKTAKLLYLVLYLGKFWGSVNFTSSIFKYTFCEFFLKIYFFYFVCQLYIKTQMRIFLYFLCLLYIKS
eukprot:TRINITY_DN28785_c0_g1_i6.p1 TRINITY_DN28785_c0_g1~~TRINITY_DN28785_c0_g1_i6.p1  ORF type:complete len:189 (-),score=-23.79 TRINITY_DN28785_c0_g1_i6:434-1000(-)